MSEYIQVLTTVSSEEEAEKIAYELLENRVAACVQIVGPIASCYLEAGIKRLREWQCLAKTETDFYEAVESVMLAYHSYKNPEVIATPIVNGSPPFLAWISANVGEEED